MSDPRGAIYTTTITPSHSPSQVSIDSQGSAWAPIELDLGGRDDVPRPSKPLLLGTKFER